MFLRSPALKNDYQLGQGITHLGRSPRCDIVLSFDNVSKQHLELRLDHDKVFVRDAGSRNGTSLNGYSIRGEGWFDLKLGDQLNVCGHFFQLLSDTAPDGGQGICRIEEDSDSSGDFSGGESSISMSHLDSSSDSSRSQLQALLAMTETLRDVLQTDQVLHRAVGQLLEIFPGIERAAICFVDADGKIVPRWWKVREGIKDKDIRISQSIGKHVVDTADAVITNNAMADFNDAGSVHALAMTSIMCVPLTEADGKVFGLIYVDAAKPELFWGLDLEMLAAVAVQISLAISYSRLHAAAIEDAVLRSDVERARGVQEKILPKSAPSVVDYDLDGFYRPARHVGGDYIDYVALDHGKLAVVLGDVVGKGVPAALTMAALATATRTLLESTTSPSTLMNRLNQKFNDDFITLVVLILDTANHVVTMSNAGHEPPLLRGADGTVKSMGYEGSGCPLGVMADAEYEQMTVTLEPDESLVIVSDGFTEAQRNDSDDQFGSEPIGQLLATFNGSATEFIECTVELVDRFVDGSPQHDDMCLVYLRRLA